MCVVFACTKSVPSADDLFAAEEINSHGAGIAWVDRKAGLVRWKKGIEADEVAALAAKLPLPMLIHFRIASVGPEVPALTHPFPLDSDASLALNGATPNGVLMHNGTLGGWQTDLKQAAYQARMHIPVGPWSDTRAMAWIIANFGIGMMDLIRPAQKLVILHPKDGILLGPDVEWFYSLDKGFIFSNRGWIKEKKKKDKKEEVEAEVVSGTKSLGAPPQASAPPPGSKVSIARCEDLVRELGDGTLRLVV